MKKNLVKRLLAFGLASALLLSACGSSSSSDADTDDDSDADTEADADADDDADDEVVELDDKTIQIWLLGPGEQTDSDMVWEAWNEMLQEYVPNTTVEWTVISGTEYKDSFNRMLAAGEAVDLAWVGYATDFAIDVEDGNILALDDLLAEYAPSVLDINGEACTELSREVNGELYKVDAWQGIVGGPSGIYILEETADLAGGDDLTGAEWAEEIEVLIQETITDGSIESLEAFYDAWGAGMANVVAAGEMYGGIDYRSNISFTFSYGYDFTPKLGAEILNTGVVFGDDTFTVVDSLLFEELQLKYAYMAEYYEAGYFRSDIASLTQTWVTDGVVEADDQIIFAHNNFGTEDDAVRTALQGVDTLVIAKYDMFTMTESNSAVGVPYCADDAERALMVLEALYTVPELYQLLIYGIEGTHYTDNGDGTITTDYGAQGTAETAYGLWKWTIGTCLNSLVTQADTAGTYEYYKALEEQAYVNVTTGFAFDRTDSTIDAIYTALTAVDLEYSPMFEAGYLGVDGWEAKYDEWMAARTLNGVETLMEEYQAQLDAFLDDRGITSWDYEYVRSDRTVG